MRERVSTQPALPCQGLGTGQTPRCPSVACWPAGILCLCKYLFYDNQINHAVFYIISIYHYQNLLNVAYHATYVLYTFYKFRVQLSFFVIYCRYVCELSTKRIANKLNRNSNRVLTSHVSRQGPSHVDTCTSTFSNPAAAPPRHKRPFAPPTGGCLRCARGCSCGCCRSCGRRCAERRAPEKGLELHSGDERGKVGAVCSGHLVVGGRGGAEEPGAGLWGQRKGVSWGIVSSWRAFGEGWANDGGSVADEGYGAPAAPRSWRARRELSAVRSCGCLQLEGRAPSI
jgi:hypothetical protein